MHCQIEGSVSVLERARFSPKFMCNFTCKLMHICVLLSIVHARTLSAQRGMCPELPSSSACGQQAWHSLQSQSQPMVASTARGGKHSPAALAAQLGWAVPVLTITAHPHQKSPAAVVGCYVLFPICAVALPQV